MRTRCNVVHIGFVVESAEDSDSDDSDDSDEDTTVTPAAVADDVKANTTTSGRPFLMFLLLKSQNPSGICRRISL